MTLPEFKAWLDGFKEALGDAPTPDQWEKVLAKLREVWEPVSLGPLIDRLSEPRKMYEGPFLPYGPAVACGSDRMEGGTGVYVNGGYVGSAD